MKKKLLSGVLFSFLSVSLFAQTIVSTTPEDRKVILEVFTGIYCVFCPDGQQVANGILANNPNDFFWINIHVGGFANPQGSDPDFRTQWGLDIQNQAFAGATQAGYPSGTINRHDFPEYNMGGSSMVMGRGSWVAASNQIFPQSSYVNVGVEADIDVQTREMTVHVEAYYTGNSPVATNKLNVALLQNNTKGPQTGGNMGDNYTHQRRLVDLLTGQWGIDITTTSAGSFIDETFVYTIPADYNGIVAELADLQLVAFVAEDTDEIISGAWDTPTFTNLAHNDDAAITNVVELEDTCSGEIEPTITIQNLGNNTLTTLDIEYSVNGETPEIYIWTGNLPAMHYEEVALPAITFDVEATNTLEISIPADDDLSNNEGSVSFDEAVETVSTMTLTIQTDNWGNECSWNIVDGTGATVESGSGYGNNQSYTINLTLPQECYRFNLLDSYGDGGNTVTLEDAYGTVAFAASGNYGSSISSNFSTDGTLNNSTNDLQTISLYPNPTEGIVNVATDSLLSVEVYNLEGKLVFTQEQVGNDSQLDFSALKTGLYFVHLQGDGVSQVQKIVRR